jgi:hypothetical protein
VTGKYAVNNCDEACTQWKYDANGCGNLYHKSIEQTKSIAPMHENEWRITETNLVPATAPPVE